MHSVLSHGGPGVVIRHGKTIYMLERPVYLALLSVESENVTSAVNQQGSRPFKFVDYNKKTLASCLGPASGVWAQE